MKPLGGSLRELEKNMANWKHKIWSVLMVTCWSLAGAGLVALLVAAVNRKDEEICKGYNISIHGANEQLFLDKADILDLLPNGKNIQGSPVAALDLRGMEEKLEQHAWIREVELFVDNNSILRIKVEEREPVARVFTVGGNSYYIDSACERLPLTDKIAVRLPVFTGFPSDARRLSKADRSLMREVKEISSYITSDPFWTAQVAQVDITAQRNFEIVPTVGNHIIELGDGKNVEQKFRRLMVFYQEVLSKAGLNAYEKVNVQFDRQVIGKRKEVRLSRWDSVQAVKKIQQLILAAQRIQPDTVQSRTMRPLEANTISEQQLRNYDLLPVRVDSTDKPINQ
jgi:cell division protein FtsQ